MPRSLEETINARNALAQALYVRLFGWIVKKLNENLVYDSQKLVDPRLAKSNTKCLGL